MEMVVTTGAISRATLHSNHHHQQTNTQFYYRLDALPVNQPTVSKHWRDNSKVSPLNLKNANAKLLHFPTYWYGWGWMWCIPISQCTSVIQWYRQKDLLQYMKQLKFWIITHWNNGHIPAFIRGTESHYSVICSLFDNFAYTDYTYSTFAEDVAIFLGQRARVELLVTQQTCEAKHVIYLSCRPHTHRHRQCF